MTAPPPAEPAAETLNHRIRADIETLILSGTLKPGDRIPFEHELTLRYGCSRMTVNKALSTLAEAGLIERRRRAGSFVRRPVEQTAVLNIPDIKAEIGQRGSAYRYELLRSVRRTATRADRDALGIGDGAAVISLECLHLADGAPFALERRRLNIEAVPEAAAVDFVIEPPGTWLLSHVPWTDAEHRIAAEAADSPTARALRMEPGAPCLVVRRKTFRAGQTITEVALHYPGDRHELVARFTP